MLFEEHNTHTHTHTHTEQSGERVQVEQGRKMAPMQELVGEQPARGAAAGGAARAPPALF